MKGRGFFPATEFHEVSRNSYASVADKTINMSTDNTLIVSSRSSSLY